MTAQFFAREAYFYFSFIGFVDKCNVVARRRLPVFTALQYMSLQSRFL